MDENENSTTEKIETVASSEIPITDEKKNSTTPKIESYSEEKLAGTPINDKYTALNFMVCFLLLAKRRGVFSEGEIKKIQECIEIFQ